MDYLELYENGEGRFRNKCKLDEKELVHKFVLYAKNIDNNLPKELVDEKTLTYDYIVTFFLIYPLKLQEYVINSIVKKVNKEDLIYTYIMMLTKYSSQDDIYSINIIMSSFKKTGIIDDIKYDKDEETFIITIGYEKYRFSYYTNDLKKIKKYSGDCHNVCQEIMKDNIGKLDFYFIVSKFKYFNDASLYHSVLYKDNYVYDPARNIIMPFEFFRNYLKPDILILANFITAKKEILKVENGDDLPTLLKLGLYKEYNK